MRIQRGIEWDEHYGGGVCPELPDLIDFEMVVWSGPEGQRASLAFQERTAALAGQPPTSSNGSFQLAVYCRGTLKSLKRFGPLEVGKPPECFHIEPLRRASEFVFKFYTHLSLPKPARLCSQLIFCQTEFGLIVGIGPNRDSHGTWKSSDYGFKLKLRPAHIKEMAVFPKASRKRTLRRVSETTVKKHPRRVEEAPGGTNDELASSLSDAKDLQV
ncbi:hypothetical protein FOZ61_006640 [Perkinsus olseni]|uniref:Uncharacterized protein n=1 Tax=Perkinsus olseni TaxID=32597 RepID=A0A7J6LC61_PEROL|nr:hypothetical protein FOZ61_006640 [Perkinsus olseni]